MVKREPDYEQIFKPGAIVTPADMQAFRKLETELLYTVMEVVQVIKGPPTKVEVKDLFGRIDQTLKIEPKLLDHLRGDVPEVLANWLIKRAKAREEAERLAQQ